MDVLNVLGRHFKGNPTTPIPVMYGVLTFWNLWEYYRYHLVMSIAHRQFLRHLLSTVLLVSTDQLAAIFYSTIFK